MDPEKYLVAVSGGVDSVVLLHMLAIANPNFPNSNPQIIVAHFDHGIRPDSADDARFVGELARQYGLVFETRREELGPNSSEELARTRRYAFLREMALKHSAKITTAHHADDIVETIAINLTRGTGWRGLAVLDSPDIERPLLHMTKSGILQYAARHNLEWHEDSTNQNPQYLRNRIRQQLVHADQSIKAGLLELYARQLAIKREIDQEVRPFVQGGPPWSRYFLTHCGDVVAVELLRAICLQITGTSPTIPQRKRALHAIKVGRPSSSYDVDGVSRFTFTSTEFVVETS